MLYEYLMTNYNPNEPIFISDINLPISNGNLRKKIKELCDAGKIKRFDTGIYYLPKKSRLKGDIPLSVDTVARYKYISRNGNIVCRSWLDCSKINISISYLYKISGIGKNNTYNLLNILILLPIYDIIIISYDFYN